MAGETDISHLYKYRPVDGDYLQWLLDTLNKSTVYFASVRDFNDPFDCRPIYSFDGTQQELKQYASGVIARRNVGATRTERRRLLKIALNVSNHPEWLERLSFEMRQCIENDVGVYCLSENPDNILMWGHYANCHRGVVLRFKATATTPFFGAAQRVTYQSGRPTVNPIKQSATEQTEAGVLSKALDWAYEKEWRIVDHDHGPGPRTFPPELLDAVILGAHIDRDAEARIRAAIQGRSAPTKLFRARIDAKSFRLIISPA